MHRVVSCLVSLRLRQILCVLPEVLEFEARGFALEVLGCVRSFAFCLRFQGACPPTAAASASRCVLLCLTSSAPDPSCTA